MLVDGAAATPSPESRGFELETKLFSVILTCFNTLHIDSAVSAPPIDLHPAFLPTSDVYGVVEPGPVAHASVSSNPQFPRPVLMCNRAVQMT